MALVSALRQRDVALEVIVVDDGSLDDTQSTLSQVGDPRVAVVRHHRSVGVSRARNSGIDQARGRWVAFLDDDDVWAPQKLRAQLDRGAAVGASFVFSSMVAFDDNNGLQKRVPAVCPDERLSVILERNVVGSPSTVIARTEVVREVGGFDPDLSLIADWDLWIRLARSGIVTACNEILVGYRLHQGNMYATVQLDDLRREHEYLASKYGRDHLGLRESYPSSAAWAHRRAGRRLLASSHYLRAGLANGEATDLFRAVGILPGERTMALVGRSRHVHVPPLKTDWLHPSYRKTPRG